MTALLKKSLLSDLSTIESKGLSALTAVGKATTASSESSRVSFSPIFYS